MSGRTMAIVATKWHEENVDVVAVVIVPADYSEARVRALIEEVNRTTPGDTALELITSIYEPENLANLSTRLRGILQSAKQRQEAESNLQMLGWRHTEMRRALERGVLTRQQYEENCEKAGIPRDWWSR